jgi:hypothetical protein
MKNEIVEELLMSITGLCLVYFTVFFPFMFAGVFFVHFSKHGLHCFGDLKNCFYLASIFGTGVASILS